MIPNSNGFRSCDSLELVRQEAIESSGGYLKRNQSEKEHVKPTEWEPGCHLQNTPQAIACNQTQRSRSGLQPLLAASQ